MTALPLPKDVTFGSMIRAHRCGFAWSEIHKAYIRVSDGPRDGLFRFEVLPHLQLRIKSRSYRAWWDNPSMLDLCEPLRDVESPTQALTFIVDELGREVLNV